MIIPRPPMSPRFPGLGGHSGMQPVFSPGALPGRGGRNALPQPFPPRGGPGPGAMPMPMPRFPPRQGPIFQPPMPEGGAHPIPPQGGVPPGFAIPPPLPAPRPDVSFVGPFDRGEVDLVGAMREILAQAMFQRPQQLPSGLLPQAAPPQQPVGLQQLFNFGRARGPVAPVVPRVPYA